MGHLADWAAGGGPPPAGARLKLDTSKANEVSIARDQDGNALGGVRNPMVDVPVVALTGEAPAGTKAGDVEKSGGTCLLFGKTTAFDKAKLVEMYGTPDAYVAAFRKSADAAVTSGFLLQPDADSLIAEAEGNRALFG
jgi:hypothetical protein